MADSSTGYSFTLAFAGFRSIAPLFRAPRLRNDTTAPGARPPALIRRRPVPVNTYRPRASSQRIRWAWICDQLDDSHAIRERPAAPSLRDVAEQADIAPLEADAVLLAILRGMRALLDDRRIARAFAEGHYTVLKSAYELCKMQVTVDEATDFSPIQLACMASLCDPVTRSFLACGDFNQRITEWGSRSIDDLKWVFSDFDIRRIGVTYRHSRQLLELAQGIAALSDSGDVPVELPEHVDNDGVAPLLMTNLSDWDAVAERLASSIGQIERFTRLLPTIAVLVSEEAEVIPLAEALDRFLAGTNIRAVSCQRGTMVGQDNDVKVFDVQHIKGLEFEAVFFVGIDRLAERKPNLFDKYLYVGAIRAAMYLGLVTGASSLPDRILALRPQFTDQWPDSI